MSKENSSAQPASATPQSGDHNGDAQPFPLRVRIVQIIFLIVAVLATLGLAYWQWTRFTSNDGDFQNLGYALQWPVFGAFFIIAYTKYIQYERERLQGEDMAAVPQEVRGSMREIPDSFIELPGQHKPTDLNGEALEDDRRRAARSKHQNEDTQRNENPK